MFEKSEKFKNKPYEEWDKNDDEARWMQLLLHLELI